MDSLAGDVRVEDPDGEEEEIVFVVDKKDFEKNYEVE